jgi:hypothetical protein
MMFGQPVLVELLWCLVAQRLMGPHPFVDPVPGKQRCLKPAQIGGQLLNLVELFLVSTERAFHLPIPLRVVGPIEVVGDLKLLGCLPKRPQELTATV